MQLALIDWLAVAAYFLFNILIGLYYGKRATASTEDYFIGGTQGLLVAGRHLHGGHDLCRRYAAGRHRTCSQLRNRRELALVEHADERHADGLSLCPFVAPRRGPDRCGVC